LKVLKSIRRRNSPINNQRQSSLWPTLTRSKNQQQADALFALRLEATRFEQSLAIEGKNK
jgi:hypothetical protein